MQNPKLKPEQISNLAKATEELSREFAEKVLDKMNEFPGNTVADVAVPITLMSVTVARAVVDLVGATALRLGLTEESEVEKLGEEILQHIRIPLRAHYKSMALAIGDEMDE